MSNQKYQPINCDFHDYLEELSTLNKQCEIVYRADDGSDQIARGHIVDVFTEDSQEFLKLTNNTKLRLDQLKSVNGQARP
jgi:Rho-binding antiterminator